MHAIQLIQQEFANTHMALREDMAEVPADWLFWQPEPGLNHIGFLFWHLVRDEDTVVSWVTHQPELWVSAAWHERLGTQEIPVKVEAGKPAEVQVKFAAQ